MTTITIVTAYFDIGRSQWTSQNGFAPRIERTTDEYMTGFPILLNSKMTWLFSPHLTSNQELRKSGEETNNNCYIEFQ